MKKEEIERILKEEGWERTVSAPPEMLDYQRSAPFNRLIIYPQDMKYLTFVTLRELMDQTNLALHAEILLKAKETYRKMVEEKEVKPPTEVPEGVELVRFELYADTDAESAETMFLGIMSGKYEFKSAVNLGKMVRTVMYEKGARAGTPIQIVTTSKEMAWSLQQTIDWAHEKLIVVVAVRREGKVIEVAYLKLGIKPPPPKEKLIYSFQKTDGWTLVGEEKPRRPPP